MGEKTIQGKAESKHWKRDATLKDLLSLLDQIENSNKTPEEKAKLTQRVVDYGQFLSKEIYEGKRKLDPSDDNETIKKFNIRMYSTYYTKGESSYEEAKRPTGYFDENRKFVRDPYEGENPGTRNHKNPRWHPIPLREETEVVVPPVVGPEHVTEPHRGQTGGVVVGPHQEGPEYAKDGGTGGIIPPVQEGAVVSGHSISPTELSNSGASEGLESAGKDKDKDKKRRRVPLWLLPLIAGTLVLGDKNKTQNVAPVNDGEQKDKPEQIVQAPLMTQTESDFLKYTIEKGQRMCAKQFGVSVDEGAEIYNRFVENIKDGKLPQAMTDLAEKYQMSKMLDKDLGIDLDRPEIMATSLCVMSESYEAITKIIHNAMTKPQEQVSPSNEVRLKKAFSMAHAAAVKHNVNEESNQVVTVDYGLYGASKQTGWAISFREAEKQADKANYQEIVENALQKGIDY